MSGNFYFEESRIRGGYNNVSAQLGVRAYLNEERINAEHRFNSLIYSGIFNSRTGRNDTNVFSIGQAITASVDPANASIQKLYAEDTNLIVFQENKVSRVLIDKDAIYSAEGGGTVTSSTAVLGETIPYLGEYGISKNPESFAVYGFKKYFADRNRSAILRLSRDGLTEISSYGMTDYFRDYLETIPEDYLPWYVIGEPEGYGAVLPITAAGDQISIASSSLDGNLELGDSVAYSIDGGINYIPINSIVTEVNLSGVENCTLIGGGIDYSIDAATPTLGTGVGLLLDVTLVDGAGTIQTIDPIPADPGTGYTNGEIVTVLPNGVWVRLHQLQVVVLLYK